MKDVVALTVAMVLLVVGVAWWAFGWVAALYVLLGAVIVAIASLTIIMRVLEQILEDW